MHGKTESVSWIHSKYRMSMYSREWVRLRLVMQLRLGYVQSDGINWCDIHWKVAATVSQPAQRLSSCITMMSMLAVNTLIWKDLTASCNLWSTLNGVTEVIRTINHVYNVDLNCLFLLLFILFVYLSGFYRLLNTDQICFHDAEVGPHKVHGLSGVARPVWPPLCTQRRW